MIVDTSALVAIILREPEGETYLTLLEASRGRVSAGTWVEFGTVAVRRLGLSAIEVQELCDRLHLIVEPVSEKQAWIAHAAYRAFGMGRHLARLNFGDCFAYALAKETGEPLLFKGDDFVHTDIVAAV